MIPIKNPNISTNRYKELLQIEKYYHKLQKEDSKLIEEYKDKIDKLYDEIGILEERIDNAIEYVNNNSLYEQDYDYDYEENLVEYPPSDELARKHLLEILKGNDK